MRGKDSWQEKPTEALEMGRASLSVMLFRNRGPVTVIAEDGQGVALRPAGMEPLPELKASIPSGWKDGVYIR